MTPVIIPGQPLAERILSASATRPSPPQQLLLHGPTGAGKHRAARAFAWAIVDPGVTHDPSDESIDIDTARATGNVLRMDEQLDAQLLALSARPAVGARRVLIIDGADDLQDHTGASRILKILEEPPPLSHIILITENPSRLLPTIRSRCMAIPFRNPGWAVVARELEARGTPPVEARARARADGLLALQVGPFERRLRSLGADLGVAVLEESGGGIELVHDIQSAMTSAAGEHPSDELIALRAAAADLEGKRGGKTAAKKAEDQEKRERRRLVTDGWEHVLDGMVSVLADALAVATGSAVSVRHEEVLDRLRAVAHPGRRVQIESWLGEVQRTRAGLGLNPMVDLWVEGLLNRMALSAQGRGAPPPAPGRLAA